MLYIFIFIMHMLHIWINIVQVHQIELLNNKKYIINRYLLTSIQRLQFNILVSEKFI